MSAPLRARENRWRIAGGAAAVLFAVLVLRFWHPVYGFTRFLQLDAENDGTKIQAFRDQPIYVYRNTGGYDGQYYAQIANHPLLNAPELRTAVDNLNYRARRILPAVMAWVIAGGRAGEIARVYAWLNVVCWFVLAGMAWRVLEVADGKSFVAWAGILFSAGTLLSVRFALTDLIAATLTLAAVGGARPPPLSKNQTVHAGVGGARPPGALGIVRVRDQNAVGPSAPGTSDEALAKWEGRAPPTLALAALGRETALLALPGIWTRPWFSRKNLSATIIATVPLALWLAYIRLRLGPGDAGFSNFTWPLLGLANKWIASVRALHGPVDFALTFSTLLAVAGLTIQGTYCIFRPRFSEPWWRVSIAYVVLLVFLGQAVWEGFPGAAFRAVLPLTLACNLLMGRRQANWLWLIGGNLTVAAGLVALWQVPIDPRELGAAAAGHQRAIFWEGSGWYGAEHSARHSWAWAGGPATMAVDYWPGGRGRATLRCEAELRSLAPQHVTIRQGTRICWQGAVGPVKTPAEWEISIEGGHAAVELQGGHAPVPESAEAQARALAFAVYDLKVSFSDAPSDPH